MGLENDLPLRELLVNLLAWLAAWFVAILCHELGHALVMRAFGFTPWITLYGFGGLASYDPAQVWGHQGSSTGGQIRISAAGPVAGFILAGTVVGIVMLSGHTVEVGYVAEFLPCVWVMGTIGSQPLTDFINALLGICVFWGAINLLPIYPLDGGQIARELLLRSNPREGIRQSLLLSTVAGIGMAVIGLLQLGSLLMAIFFGLMAYQSYTSLQSYQNGGRW